MDLSEEKSPSTVPEARRNCHLKFGISHFFKRHQLLPTLQKNRFFFHEVEATDGLL